MIKGAEYDATIIDIPPDDLDLRGVLFLVDPSTEQTPEASASDAK